MHDLQRRLLFGDSGELHLYGLYSRHGDGDSRLDGMPFVSERVVPGHLGQFRVRGTGHSRVSHVAFLLLM